MINLSFSASQKYLASPMSYFLHYIMRLRPAQLSSALIFGASLDVGINSLLIDKQEGRDPDLAKAKAIFCEEFCFQEVNREVRCMYEEGLIKFSKADLDESLLTSEDRDSGLNLSWLSLNKKGQILIEEYYEQVLPRLEKVLTVQHEINLPNEQGDNLTGIVDFIAQIDGKIYLCDNKSTSIKYKENSASESEQLATYFEALKDEFKLDGVAYITISKKVLKQKLPRVNIQIIFGQISEELLNKTFHRYDDVLDGIKNERFPCTRNERDGCCSAPWPCSYVGYCRSGGEDLTGLIYHDERKKT